jgi:nucleoside-diphosphate-sugar epimerase
MIFRISYYENINQNNLIDTALQSGVEKFIFWEVLASIKTAPQPLKEEYLLTDTLEPTNEWYAIAKITGKPVKPSEINSIRIT